MTIRKAAFVAITLSMGGLAQADWSANVGYASEYHFRGLLQKNSSASGGLDYEQGGFYAGTWAADVGDGLEVDFYFGYGGEVEEFTYNVGYTGYFYTGDTFDDTYQEINLGGTYGLLSVEVAIGEHDLDPLIHGTSGTQDYTYYAISLEKDGLYGKFGGFSQDFEGEYLEFGYGTTVADIDLGVALILANDDLYGTPGDDEESVIFTLGKSFDLQ
ncbi:MAG: TorF family putative porin [Gammaproteobacteria bacterium]|nr:TorF family putative porin [Gammaproteobacteria bacterium]